MKIPISIINSLKEKLPNLKHPSCLFSFDHNKLSFRCIYIIPNSTLLITTRNNSIAWNTYIDSETGYIDTFIPNDCFKEIANYVLENGKVENFFLKLQERLYISSNNIINISSNSELIEIMESCKTKDNKVHEGERPFYDHPRRVNPSTTNLKKINRIMGSDIHNFCLENKVTIVWTDIYKPNSLDYLELEKFKKQILSDINQ
ncbi:hypothetical protein ABSA28_00840 [Candidatus Hepatincolaceae symbiont of Richtersius coronifer]